MTAAACAGGGEQNEPRGALQKFIDAEINPFVDSVNQSR